MAMYNSRWVVGDAVLVRGKDVQDWHRNKGYHMSVDPTIPEISEGDAPSKQQPVSARQKLS
jgi:hypothetical protein